MDALVSELRTLASPVFVTGAGISVASGIPTFRGSEPDAVWSTDTLEMGTLAFFQRDPVASWSWYLRRFDGCRTAVPNPAHTALVAIEAWLTENGGRSLVVTQNVDGLHAAAGTRALVEIHGAARKVRCSRRGCANAAPNGCLPWDEAWFAPFRANPRPETLPRCERCGKPLRPHVLWFDEDYGGHADYRFSHAVHELQRASALVFVGTSFSVGITELALDSAVRRRVPVWVVDPFAREVPLATAKVVREPAEQLLPWVAKQLSGSA